MEQGFLSFQKDWIQAAEKRKLCKSELKLRPGDLLVPFLGARARTMEYWGREGGNFLPPPSQQLSDGKYLRHLNFNLQSLHFFKP